MRVEIDQSGKWEQLNTHTVIACANGTSKAIAIKASIKRRIILKLRKSLVPKKDLIAVAFTVLVFLLLCELKYLPSTIVIDEEYTGKDNVIREALEKLLNKKTGGKWKGKINFRRIGKSSPAHKLCWMIHRSKRFQKIKTISEVEFMKVWV